MIVTTHFMAEAEYCDRIAILDTRPRAGPGRARPRSAPAAHGDPAAPTMEDAFIAIVEAARAAERAPSAAA